MPGLTLYTSNRLEVLAQELAGRLRRPGDPLLPAIVIVQSRGMERWLSLAIARHSGIIANCQFPFPNAFIETLFRRLFEYDPDESLFHPDVLAFRIMKALPVLMAAHPAFADLQAYLRDDSRGVKRFQLAAEIADLMDQYLLFRPEMLLSWERAPAPGISEPFPWQRELWQILTRDTTGRHRASLWQDLIEAPRLDQRPEGLPERVSLFGVSYLPPYYLKVLDVLAGTMAIDIYQLNPCREYWVDIASDREMDRIRRQLPEADHSAGADTLHLEIGNRLLASMGGHGREFQALIAQSDCPLEERFEDLVPDTLLRALQHDLLHLTQRGCGPGGKVGQPPGTETDHSIQIHACHGPMREIEILQDQLLAILDRHPDLEPRDILVLTPDIETYAPYIQAVFGSRADERLYLPFSIADRRLETASPLVETFKALLDLRASRFTSSEILTLLEFGPLRAQFELAETDLDLIASWIARARIRWGMDGASKEAWDLPPIDANTWRGGLDRLILGYAMQAEPDRLFQDILPQDRVQGSQAVVLGRLSGLIETLWEFSRDLATPRTWTRWRYRMAETLTDFFVRDERYEYDFQVLERLFEAMHHGGSMAAFNEPVDLDIVRAYLDRHLSRESYRGGFIAGGITFGALLPMRSIPAEVICLVGMNHDLFPRRDRPRSFDLMALNPRLGDRSRRSDDRYLFLEALISARRCIYISYAGFDVHDNSIRPPSVLVGELTDYLQEGFGLSEDDLVTSHRLQAFSPAYFNGEDPRLFSFNRDNAQAARNLAAPSRTRPEAVPFLHCALEKCPEHFLTLTPEDLLEALAHPCRFLLEKRLDLQLRPTDRPDEDREAFDLDALEKYREGQWLTAKTLEGMPFASALPLQKARGILPHGETGRTVFQRLADDVAEFSDRIRPHVDPPPQPPRSFQIALEGFLLRGRLETLFTNGPVIYRYAQTNARALLGAWIQHLIYCRLALAEKACGSTVLICRDEVRQFNFVEKSLPILNQLLDLYFQAAHIPLPIFPRATVAFARQRFAKRKPAPQAFQAAQRAWEGSRMFPGDKDDPYIALGFRGRQPWTEDFEEVAARLFEPIFEHSEIIV